MNESNSLNNEPTNQPSNLNSEPVVQPTNLNSEPVVQPTNLNNEPVVQPTNLNSEPVAQPTNLNNEPMNNQLDNQPKKNNTKNIIIIVIVALVVLIGIGIGVTVLLNKNKDNNVNDNNINNSDNNNSTDNSNDNNLDDNVDTNTNTENSDNTDDNTDTDNNVNTNNIENVSSEWKNYEFSVNGEKMVLPCTYPELSNATGFKMKSANEKSYLSKNYYASVNLYKNDKLALYTEIYNDTSDDVQYIDAKVTRVWQSKYQVSQGADVITYPGNLQVGMKMTEEELVNKLGKYDDKKEYNAENYNSVTYKYISDTNWTTTNYYEVKILNGEIDEITLDNR